MRVSANRMPVLTTNHMGRLSSLQLFQITGNAQAKIEDVSRALLNQVSQMPGKMPSSLKQVTTANNQPFADMSKKLAVRVHVVDDAWFCHLILL